MLKFRKLTHSNLFAYLFHYPSVFFGILAFTLTRKTPWVSYWSMRKLYATRGPAIMKMISYFCEKLDSKHHRPESWDKNSIFNYTDVDVKKISDAVKKDGYCIMPFQLPDTYIDQLTKLATTAECTLRQVPVPGRHRINLEKPIAPWYKITEDYLVADKNVIQLANDSLFLDIAKAYIGKPPINDLLALWWTMPFEGADKDLLAQMYHFDYDRLNFIKFFFYLTDVDLTNGPHCFIKGSHANKSSEFSQDRRYTDEEILKNYGKENEIIMTGHRGMILAEDTSGFHKGLSPEIGHRLMFQLEYTSCLFGQEYYSSDIKDELPEIYQTFKKHPTLWQRFIK